MSGEQYRSYPESLTMRQVSVDARDKDNRAEQFKVVTTILDAAIDGGLKASTLSITLINYLCNGATPLNRVPFV